MAPQSAEASLSSLSLSAVRQKLACPACHAPLRDTNDGFECTSCPLSYSISNGVPILLTPASEATIAGFRADAENVRLRQSIGRSKLLLALTDAIRPPHPFWYMRRRASHAQRVAFTRIAETNSRRDDAVFLDIGSGILGGLNASGLSDYVRRHIVPLEIAPTAGIGIVGDAHLLPFADASVDGVLIQGVLEHVLDPERIVAEIHRVLRPGAPVFSEVPFIQHYHLDPVDFRRWTHYGFSHLFRDFDEVSHGVCAGPAAALTDMLTEFPALLFANPKLYWGAKFISGWLFSPLQLLDVFWASRPRSHIMAAAVYFLGRRPQERS